MVFAGICKDISRAFIFAGTRASSNSNIPHASRLLSTLWVTFAKNSYVCRFQQHISKMRKHSYNEDVSPMFLSLTI